MRVEIGDVTLDTESRLLVRAGQMIRLSAKGWKLLEALIESAPRALSKDALQERIWPDTFVQESNLAGLVNDVRFALGDDARRPRFVRTVHAFGYAWAAAPDASFRVAVRAGGSGVIYRLRIGGSEVDLAEGENVFGRDRDAAVWLTERSISRRHARIVVTGDAALLEDLGSKNGTFHRGARISSPVRLNDGDEIAIGNVPATVVIVEPGASTATASTS